MLYCNLDEINILTESGFNLNMVKYKELKKSSKFSLNFVVKDRMTHGPRIKIMLGKNELATIPVSSKDLYRFDDIENSNGFNAQGRKDIPDELFNVAKGFAVFASVPITSYFNDASLYSMNEIKTYFIDFLIILNKDFGTTNVRKITNQYYEARHLK